MQHCNPALISGECPYLVNVSWNLDKYPEAPEFLPHSKLTILDADGPAMITNIHASAYYQKGRFAESETAACSMWLRVYYDGSEIPAIDMPLMDFLGDVDCCCKPYATQYFSKVKESHNFYLTMPFERHIKIEVENRSNVDLNGYMTLQVEPLSRWDADLGYLYTQYREADVVLPDDVLDIMDVEGNGTLVAHWLQIHAESPLCRNGDYICEGNDEFYLDGEETPSLEYLGTEDLYGFSWGFQGQQSDGRSAIIREDKSETGIKLCMLRTRREDKIRFTRSCRVIINYAEEFFSAFTTNPRYKEYKKEQLPISYKSCSYYYQLAK